MTSFIGRFDLDIASAIADQLGAFLEALTPASLGDAQAMAVLPRVGGVYSLYHEGQPVYVGKADSLIGRLRQHAGDFDGRQHISGHAMGFT